MDTLLGVQYNGGVVMACDQSNAFSILLNQSNLDKIVPMTEHSMMGVAGPHCDATNFAQYIAKNIQLYHYAGNYSSGSTTGDDGNKGGGMSLHAQVHFTRNELAQALRRAPYQVNVLYGGIDQRTQQAGLYIMDYMAAVQKVPFGAQGYAAYFCLGIFDKEYVKPVAETTLDDAVAMLHKCIHELQTRFLLSQPNFLIKVVNEKGIRTVSQGADPADT